MTAIPAVQLADHAAAVRETFTLPPGRTVEEAIAVAKKHRYLIWEGRALRGLTDEQKIGLLKKTCTEMCCGDAESGARLAQIAIYTVSR